MKAKLEVFEKENSAFRKNVEELEGTIRDLNKKTKEDAEKIQNLEKSVAGLNSGNGKLKGKHKSRQHTFIRKAQGNGEKVERSGRQIGSHGASCERYGTKVEGYRGKTERSGRQAGSYGAKFEG